MPKGEFPAAEGILVMAIYLKIGEILASGAFEARGKDFASQSPEVRFAISRYAVNAGTHKKDLRDVIGGKDIPRTGTTRRDPHHPLRTAVLHAARGLHLSTAVFGLGGNLVRAGLHPSGD